MQGGCQAGRYELSARRRIRVNFVVKQKDAGTRHSSQSGAQSSAAADLSHRRRRWRRRRCRVDLEQAPRRAGA